jgi:predicted esterase
MRQFALVALFALCLLHTTVQAQEPADVVPSAAAAQPAAQPAGESRIIGVDATAVLPCIVQLPADFDQQRSYPLVIGLHGYSSTAARFATNWNAFDQPQFIYACPCGPYPVQGAVLGFSWYLFETGMPEIELRTQQYARDFVLQLISQLKAEYNISAVYLLGFSQGGRLACDTGLLHPDVVQGIACLAAPHDAESEPDAVLNAARGLRVMLGVGTEDPLRPGVQSMRDKLTAGGLDVKYLEYPGRHSFSQAEMQEFQQWLAGAPGA